MSKHASPGDKPLSPGVKAVGGSGTSMVEDVAFSEIGARSGRSAMISLGARLLNLALTLGAQSMLGRLLDPSEYGLFAMGQTALAFLLIFREFGLQAAGIQRERLSYAEASFLFWASLLLISALGFIGIVTSSWVARFYEVPEVQPILMAMSVAAILGGVSAQHAMIMRRQFRFAAIALIDTIALGCGVAAGVLVGWLRHDVWALLTMYIVQQAVLTILYFLATSWVPSRPTLIQGSHLSMLRFGAGVTVANVLFYLTNNISAILVGRELGAAALGHLNRAQQLNSIPSTVLFSSVYVVVFASLSRFKDDAASYRAFYKSTLRRVSMLYMTIAGILLFAGLDLVRVLIGPGWSTAGHVLQILSVSLIGSGMSQMTGMLYQSQGRLKDLQIWSVIDASIRITCIALSSRWGLMGLAFGFALSTTLITAPASLWFAGRKGPVTLKDQIAAVSPSGFLFLFALAGAGIGHVLVSGVEPGLLTLAAKSFAGLTVAVVLGVLLPVTRGAIWEVVHGLKETLRKTAA